MLSLHALIVHHQLYYTVIDKWKEVEKEAIMWWFDELWVEKHEKLTDQGSLLPNNITLYYSLFPAQEYRSHAGSRSAWISRSWSPFRRPSVLLQMCYSSFIVRPPQRKMDGACPPAGNLIMAPLIKHHSLRTHINSLSTSSGSLIKLWQREVGGGGGGSDWETAESCCGAALLILYDAFCKITSFSYWSCLSWCGRALSGREIKM